MTTIRRLVLACILVGLVLPGPVLAADRYEADTNHELATTAAINKYQETGSVSGDVVGLNTTLTVGDDAADVGLEGWKYLSSGREFLRIDYNEEIPRTVRFYLPAEYVEPQLKTDLEALNGDLTASLEPTHNRTYTAVTVTLDGPTDVVFPISEVRGDIASGRSWASDLVSNATGVDLPSITSGGAEWTVIDSESLAQNETTPIPANEPTIQYDADPSTAEQWVPVQECDGSDRAVCSFTKTGENNTTYLLSTTSDPPQVRWRSGSSVTGTIGESINDAQHAVDELLADINSWFGG